jgi:hypothetical protein
MGNQFFANGGVRWLRSFGKHGRLGLREPNRVQLASVPYPCRDSRRET